VVTSHQTLSSHYFASLISIFCPVQRECPRCTFIKDYTNQGYKPEVKRKIVDMSVNGSGVRDTARVLKVSTATVIKELKKRKSTPKS